VILEEAEVRRWLLKRKKREEGREKDEEKKKEKRKKKKEKEKSSLTIKKHAVRIKLEHLPV
jgi:hypothetical protein